MLHPSFSLSFLFNQNFPYLYIRTNILECSHRGYEDHGCESDPVTQGTWLELAASLRTISWLRRVLPDIENAESQEKAHGTQNKVLRALFLVCRFATLMNMLNALDPLRELADQEKSRQKSIGSGNAWSEGQQTERYLKRYIHLPHLTALDLGSLVISKDTLISVLSKFSPNLKHLSLWRMTIDGPLDGSRPNNWSLFFKDLAAMPKLELSYLKVGAIMQGVVVAHFNKEGGDEYQYETLREYSGSWDGMKRFIHCLVRDVEVDWPDDDDAVESDESDSDEDEDMDEDEDQVGGDEAE